MHADGGFSIHNLGLVGHIEDIAVTKDQQGKKLGLRIIEALDYVAKKVGCYKVGSFTTPSFGGAIAGQAQICKGFYGPHATSQHIQWINACIAHRQCLPTPVSTPALHPHRSPP